MAFGEGATSMGSMVPLVELADATMAQAAARTLEAHAILAIIDGDIVSASVPKSPSGRPRVWVPSSMFEQAQVILQNHADEIRTAPRPPEPPPTFADARLLSDDDHDHDHEEQLPELQPPEPSSLQLRLLFALGAIALGLGLQLGFEAWLGSGQVRGSLGATQPLLLQPWRLVTASFLHGSFSHAFSNGAFGLLLGTVLLGTHRIGATALVWLLSSAVGLAAEASLSPGSLVIGASAGNYGLVGLWAIGQLQRAQTTWLVRRELIRTAGVLLLLLPGAITPFSSTGSRIAVLAHVFGFLAGMALGLVYRRRLVPDELEAIDKRSRLGGGIALVITLAAWGAAAVTIAST